MHESNKSCILKLEEKATTSVKTVLSTLQDINSSVRVLDEEN